MGPRLCPLVLHYDDEVQRCSSLAPFAKDGRLERIGHDFTLAKLTRFPGHVPFDASTSDQKSTPAAHAKRASDNGVGQRIDVLKPRACSENSPWQRRG
jgi:hypothetical protein